MLFYGVWWDRSHGCGGWLGLLLMSVFGGKPKAWNCKRARVLFGYKRSPDVKEMVSARRKKDIRLYREFEFLRFHPDAAPRDPESKLLFRSKPLFQWCAEESLKKVWNVTDLLPTYSQHRFWNDWFFDPGTFPGSIEHHPFLNPSDNLQRAGMRAAVCSPTDSILGRIFTTFYCSWSTGVRDTATFFLTS